MKRGLRRLAIAAAVLLGFGVAGLMCQRVGARGRYATAFSTYGAGEDGTRGLFLLTERLGKQPVRWAEDLGRLPDGAMLVALGTCDAVARRELARHERERLREWVERGGVLVVAGIDRYLGRGTFGVELEAMPGQCRRERGLIARLQQAEDARDRKDPSDLPVDSASPLDQLAEDFEEDPSGTYDEVIAQDELPEPQWAVATAAPLLGMPHSRLREPLAIALADGADAETLLELDESGRPAAVRVRLGRGSVIAIGSASLFANRDLREHQGGVLFARLLREHRGPVLFDEYHLGVGERRSTVRYLRQVGALALIAQVLALAALLLWRRGARFGAPRVEPPPDPEGTASYVDGVGTLYASAKDPAGAAAIVVRRGIHRIAMHHHQTTTDPARLAQLLEEHHRTRAALAVRELSRLLEPSAERGLTQVVAEVDRLVREATDEAPRAVA